MICANLQVVLLGRQAGHACVAGHALHALRCTALPPRSLFHLYHRCPTVIILPRILALPLPFLPCQTGSQSCIPVAAHEICDFTNQSMMARLAAFMVASMIASIIASKIASMTASMLAAVKQSPAVPGTSGTPAGKAQMCHDA